VEELVKPLMKRAIPTEIEEKEEDEDEDEDE
jgi:hypothetical protein